MEISTGISGSFFVNGKQPIFHSFAAQSRKDFVSPRDHVISSIYFKSANYWHSSTNGYFKTTIFIVVFRKLVISSCHFIKSLLKMFLFPRKGLFSFPKTVTPLSLKCYYDQKSLLVFLSHFESSDFMQSFPRETLFILTAFFFSFNGQHYLV